jgi:AcrR family transcriptional regulator
LDILSRPSLKPRKSPVQARSAASVEAILEATTQVLLLEGKEGLTTNGVARRAGVSVGSLYQYFPNKSSLLQAALRSHLDRVYGAVAIVCKQYYGEQLGTMGKELVVRFLEAKFERIDASLALYLISDDVEGATIARMMGRKSVEAIAAMLRSSSERLATDTDAAASMLFGAMAGASRRMLESEDPCSARLVLEPELRLMVVAYLQALKSPLCLE